jgi:hypothetical protein
MMHPKPFSIFGNVILVEHDYSSSNDSNIVWTSSETVG